MIEEQFQCEGQNEEHLHFPCSENWSFSPVEMCALVKENLFSALAPICASRSEFQGGKLNFAALFCCFRKNTCLRIDIQ